MKRGYEFAKRNKVEPLKKMIGPYAPKVPRTADAITPIQVVLVALLSFVIGVALAVSIISPDVVRRIQAKEVFF
jgi:hypothetical protein